MELKRRQEQSIEDKIVKELEEAPDFIFSKFTPFEDDILRRFYPTKGARIIAEKLGKRLNQVKARANVLGIKRKTK